MSVKLRKTVKLKKKKYVKIIHIYIYIFFLLKSNLFVQSADHEQLSCNSLPVVKNNSLCKIA